MINITINVYEVEICILDAHNLLYIEIYVGYVAF